MISATYPDESPAFNFETGRLWLCGDSIFRGWALGRFPDVFTPEEIEAQPLWPLRSPGSTIDLLLGRPAAHRFSLTGIPDDRLIGEGIRHFDRHGRNVRPFDALVLLDVGIHAGDPDRHADQWSRLLENANRLPCQAFVCEAFDKIMPGEVLKSGEPGELFRHSSKFGARSHNEALRAATVGKATFIQTQEPMLAYDAALESLGLSAFHRDRIHLNIWGQLRLCKLILAAVAPAAKVKPRNVRRLMRSAWRSAKPSKNAVWSRELADQAVRLAFS